MIRHILALTAMLRAYRRTNAGTLVLVIACLTAGCAPATCDPPVDAPEMVDNDDADNAGDCGLLSCETNADCNADHPYCVKGACRTDPVMSPEDA